MIDYETYVRIRNFFSRDRLTYSQISDELGLDPRTVARWANEIMKPIAKNWLDTVANVRIHGVTGRKPYDMFAKELNFLHCLPQEPYDIGVVRQVRASRQFRVTIDTNHYSVPAQLAGVSLTAKLYPDRLCFYHDNMLDKHRYQTIVFSADKIVRSFLHLIF